MLLKRAAFTGMRGGGRLSRSVLHLVTSGRYLVQCILGWRENVHQHTKRGKSAIQKYHNYMNSYFSPRRSYRKVPQFCMGF